MTYVDKFGTLCDIGARSKDHIAFVPRASGGTWEYWERQGEIWRADAMAPVMPDGYRSGRWYGTDRHLTRQAIVAAGRASAPHAPVRNGLERESHDGCDICGGRA